MSNYLLLAGHNHGPLASLLLPWAPITVWHLIPRLLGGGFVLAAFLLVYSGAKSDLVELRLKLRYVFLFMMGLYILGVLLGEALFQGSALAMVTLPFLSEAGRLAVSANRFAGSLFCREGLLPISRPFSLGRPGFNSIPF